MKIINLKITPRASKNDLQKLSAANWRVKLTAAPVDGQANQALIKFLSKELKVSQGQIEIVKGQKSRNKVVKIQE